MIRLISSDGDSALLGDDLRPCEDDPALLVVREADVGPNTEDCFTRHGHASSPSGRRVSVARREYWNDDDGEHTGFPGQGARYVFALMAVVLVLALLRVIGS